MKKFKKENIDVQKQDTSFLTTHAILPLNTYKLAHFMQFYPKITQTSKPKQKNIQFIHITTYNYVIQQKTLIFSISLDLTISQLMQHQTPKLYKIRKNNCTYLAFSKQRITKSLLNCRNPSPKNFPEIAILTQNQGRR